MSENSNNHRKPGGQPGNHNALKHGRYIAKKNLPVYHNTAEDQVTVIDHLIHAIKRQMERTYQEGKKVHSHRQVLKTMNSLTLAAIGLCRLLHMYDRMTRYPKFAEENLEENELIAKLIATLGKGRRRSVAG